MELPAGGQAEAILGRAQVTGEEARLRELSGKSGAHTRDDLARTAREFESVFLDILMRAMRGTVPQSDLLGTGGGNRIYRQLHDSEMAKTMASTGGGLGIARLLEQQFAEQFAAEEDEAGLMPQSGPATASRGLPTPLALDRYRQGQRSVVAPAIRVSDLGELPAAPPTPVPTVAVSSQLVPNATSSTAATTAAAIEVRPPRPALVPTDRRLLAAPLAAAEADTVRQFGTDIDRAAKAAGLDPRLVLAVVMEESGGDPAARSPAGARGLMQLMPGTARDLGVQDPADPAANLGGGARYLAEQLERFDGRLDLALAAYNAGPGNVARAGGRVPAFSETRRYVERVTGRYERLCGGTELDTGRQ